MSVASEQDPPDVALMDDTPDQAIEKPAKRTKATNEPPQRATGEKTTFPLARVQRIIKADKVPQSVTQLFLGSTSEQGVTRKCLLLCEKHSFSSHLRQKSS